MPEDAQSTLGLAVAHTAVLGMAVRRVQGGGPAFAAPDVIGARNTRFDRDEKRPPVWRQA